MTTHATLGASSAHRWLVCPGSVKACDGVEDSASKHALEGTEAHELAELALTTSDTALDTYANREMAEFVSIYTDYVRQLSADADTVMIEETVHYSDWVPGGFGTADAIILRGNTLHVVDLKYGRGVQVDAEENPQGMLYALGAWSSLNMFTEIDTVRITIVQPRLDHVSEWAIGTDALLRWAEWVRQRAEATEADDAPRVPGEKQCLFCRAKHDCAALRDFTETAILTEFDNLDALPNPDTLTDDQIGAALAAKPLIEGWLSAVSNHVTERLMGGGGFPGYKLVEGRSVRKWSDEGDAARALCTLVGADKAYTHKLISPSQAEKTLGIKRKGEIAALITKPAGKPTLAPDDDKRPAINVTTDDFDVVE